MERPGRRTRPRQLIDCGDFALRCWRGESDLVPAFTLISESLEHLTPWGQWAGGHSVRRTRDFLARCETRWENGEVYNYAITKDDALAGMYQAYRTAEVEGRAWRLGYWLHPAVTGQGIATRATEAVIAEMFGLAEEEVDHLEITHDVANTASGAIPRRLGFREVGREQVTPPGPPAGVGIDVVWRLDRPGRDPEPGTAAG
ncbi:GNAT family N-acetyltransferase [Streptomyces sp. CA-111067]|uniref:GNAT family N-acetyltransferase n=1 Tax=Streptomyces sp. CA-111067 TaxID=3240046 RepID=UPI003D97E394